MGFQFELGKWAAEWRPPLSNWQKRKILDLFLLADGIGAGPRKKSELLAKFTEISSAKIGGDAGDPFLEITLESSPPRDLCLKPFLLKTHERSVNFLFARITEVCRRDEEQVRRIVGKWGDEFNLELAKRYHRAARDWFIYGFISWIIFAGFSILNFLHYGGSQIWEESWFILAFGVGFSLVGVHYLLKAIKRK